MPVTPITAYQASDGSVHASEEEAQVKQDLIDFEEWYERNKCYGRFEGCRIESREMIEWLEENSAYLKKFLRGR